MQRRQLNTTEQTSVQLVDLLYSDHQKRNDGPGSREHPAHWHRVQHVGNILDAIPWRGAEHLCLVHMLCITAAVIMDRSTGGLREDTVGEGLTAPGNPAPSRPGATVPARGTQVQYEREEKGHLYKEHQHIILKWRDCTSKILI